MSQNDVDAILKNFNITQNDIEQRLALKEYTHSLADVLVDEFYSQYLAPNPDLMHYLKNVDSTRLLKVIKEFVIYIFNAPIDSAYIARIEKIGFIHFNLQLSPAKVSYGFWAINQILNEMAMINPVVKRGRELISKFLAFVEYVMNNSFYNYHEKSQTKKRSDLQAISILDELFTALAVHKKNYGYIQHSFNTNQNYLLELDTINKDPSHCTLGQLIEKIAPKAQILTAFDIDIIALKTLHDNWHYHAQNYKSAIQNRNFNDAKNSYDALSTNTSELLKLLDIPLKEFTTNGFLSINSGMKAIQKMGNIFHNEALFSNYQEANTPFFNQLKEFFESSLSWAIESTIITSEGINPDNYDLFKKLSYGGTTFYIALKIKENINQLYMKDMMELILESLELHFSIKEREHSLMLFADKAESANKSKDIFLANMSHELRTPLNAITGFSQILMMRPDTPDNVKTYVEKINVAGNNLLHLVNTILDFAKLEAGKMQFNPVLSNIATIVSEAQTLVTPMAAKKHITLTMPRIISLNLLLDPKLFQQVLVNLLSNAIKFSAEGETVSLAITYEAKTSSYRFEVCDHGVGISKQDQEKLFEAFSQVDNVYQKEEKGTGLGLMICKKIVEELHQGRIWVESEINKGSCFYVRLPTPAIESKTYCVDKAGEKAAHILIVEDSESYQNLLIDHLQDTHRLTITDSINKAKHLLSEQQFNFVILDFFLTDGISSEILEYMEEENIHVHTIVISAEDDINISNALSESSNLESILNKDDVDTICRFLKDIKND